MDANILLQCFAGTLNHDLKIRTDAEAHLKQASATPGFLGACLDIIASNEVPENVKMSATLYFKNKIVYAWNAQQTDKLDSHIVDNDEKPVVRDMLIQTMLSCSKHSPNCLRMIKPALSIIVHDQYSSKKWDDLLPKCLELLSSNDYDMAYVGLLCLLEIFRTYRWKENDARQELETLILEYFPSLLQFADSILYANGANMDNDKFGDMTKLILKIYKLVTYYDMPFTLQRPESFIPWANFFVTIIQQPLSERILSIGDADLKSKNPWVKCKKTAYANLYRLFQRYASVTLTRKFQYDEFRQTYVEEFIPQFLQLVFQQIEQWGSGNLWISDVCLQYMLNFIEQTVVQKQTWPLVKMHYSTILQHVIFPLLCPNEETLETFDNDPQEYIHRNLELWEDSHFPDLAAISLLTTAVTKRTKFALQPTLEFTLQTLQANFTDINQMPFENAVKIESSLRIFSSILDRLVSKSSPYASEIEGFLRAFVLPLFKSPYGFLRTRVCEICSKLDGIKFNEPTFIPQIYEGIMSCLNEESDCLPVRLLAALAMQAFIHDEEFQKLLASVVVPTMQKLLAIANEFESDAISGVMQDFVEIFAEQLQPFGIELMNSLVSQFLKLAIDLNDAANIDPSTLMNADDIPDENDKQMAALGILSTVISILLSFENSQDIIRSLEQSYHPAAEFILKNDMDLFYREACEFVENSTFLLRSVSPISWKFLELIGECNNSEESMIPLYIEDFMLVINNYLLYGKDELKKNEFYSKILFEFYRKAMNSNEDNTLFDMQIIFELSQKLILALEDKLPVAWKQQFLEDVTNAIIMEKDNLQKQVAFGVTSFNVLISSLVTSPLVTLQFLQHKNLLELFFETWLTFYVPNLKRVYDIKLSIMALLSILCRCTADDFASLSLQNLLPKLGSILVDLMVKFPHALKALEEKRKEFSSDNFNSDNFEEWNDNVGDEDDDEDGDDDIAAYMEQLRSGEDGLKFISEGGFDKENFDDLEEDPLVGSLLDEINVYEVLKSSVTHLQQGSGGSIYEIIINGMSEDSKSVLQQLLAL
ncbi:hypothetical protein Kpol_1067p20 [Vanderwaltozyma polyspora DSM 70294]|uniref:Importin N-terminal domain-containing protein n=1 Tax=Vanderwaltozyma polyspora (strain ATCC 22028 / DSM 70294 / BCRC 21397 / CBS 2163 / NBRC 10782 / NRRL Y-8283 / UCD 57-17) TaxID=436907 RepID=A7TNW5_VANPO|nr:uncharacterized protein Kpol_1067p20 [Vanderwaltozyma polyspora DSM 70294]EDO16048.1 hypothetical protein Kpol_1067p20 [Vanderwaltozyma polyspora DSM 70294]